MPESEEDLLRQEIRRVREAHGLEIRELESRVKAARDEYLELQSTSAELQNTSAELQSTIAELRARKAALKRRLDYYKNPPPAGRRGGDGGGERPGAPAARRGRGSPGPPDANS